MIGPDVIEKVLGSIKRGEDYAYFFSRLQSPEWILPLLKEGFFQQPPPPVPKGPYVQLPYWPESQYLARMADQVPEIVRDVILEIPETDNSRVYEDLADATLRMTPEISAQLVGKAITWAQSKYHLLLPQKLGLLVVHLARGRRAGAALDLARALFDVLPRESDKADATAYGRSAEPRPRFSAWEYGEILRKVTPELIQACGKDGFEMLCSLLLKTLSFSRSRSALGVLEDYSCVWRPRIESEESRGDEDVKSILVTAIRNASDVLLRGGVMPIEDVVACLESHDYLVFRRLALFVLSVSHGKSGPLVGERLTDKAFFGCHAMSYEYSQLLESSFKDLGQEAQEVVLGMIAGLTQHTGCIEGADGSEQLERWERNLLGLIREYLPSACKERLAELTGKYGEAVRPEPPHEVRVVSWSGLASPKSAEDLRAMKLPEFFEFLKTWEPEKAFHVPSREGLGQMITEIASSSPDRYLREADRFKSVHLAYLYGLLRGLTAARKAEMSFDWTSALDLCQWVALRPAADEGGYSWDPAKSESLRLICSSFEKNTSELPFALRTEAWKAIEPLTHDPDPTPEREALSSEGRGDPISLAINTIRGIAIEAVVKYALWVRRHLEEMPDGQARLARGFSEIPEARTVLDSHLLPEQDSSHAIRAVYGQWYPWLALLDKPWAGCQASAIFTQEEPLRGLGDAAWETYIVFCPPYDEVYELLADRYVAAVGQLCQGRDAGHRLGDPEKKLAEHLMVYYWRGRLGFDQPRNPFAMFFESAPAKDRGIAMAFVGRSLYHTKGEIEPELLGRAIRLWEVRLSAAKRSVSLAEHKPELAAFGWWFASGKFEPGWALEQLAEALRIAKSIEAERMVVQQLMQYASSSPAEVIRCLTLLVRADLEEWSIHSWRDEAKNILLAVTHCPDKEAVSAAEDLIHELGSRGHWEFRDLLPKK